MQEYAEYCLRTNRVGEYEQLIAKLNTEADRKFAESVWFQNESNKNRIIAARLKQKLHQQASILSQPLNNESD